MAASDSPAAAAPRLSNRKKLAYSLLLLLVLALIAEAALRIANPAILRFASAARRTHEYRAWSRSDLRPASSGRFRLAREDGSLLYDFVLDVDARGLRSAEPGGLPEARSAGAERAIVHCIGDSFTMGWGVEAAECYPSRLQHLLGPDYLVLNLGVDGIGLVAALERQRRIARDYPPATVLYLFMENDVAEDEQALAHRQRWAARHAWERLYLGARRHSFLLNVPFALKWSAGLKPRMNRPEAADRADFGTVLPAEAWPAAVRQARLPDHATARALLEAFEQFRAAGTEFHAVFIQSDAESLQLARLCLERGIPLVFAAMPYELRIPGDWHVNVAGNQRLAAALAEQVFGAGTE